MLMDIIMESLSSMDEETLDSVLESMSEEEMSVINGYLDDLDTEEDDADMPDDDIEDAIESLMALDDDSLDQVIESLTTEEFEYLKAACEKAINFDRKVYDTRKNPAKFTITPEILKDAGIAGDRVDEYYDALCDYMAKKKYITCGRNASPEEVASHFKEERRIMASDITEFGWRYFKKAKIIMLKNKGDKSQLQELLDKANNKAIKSAKWEIIGNLALKIFAWEILGGILGNLVVGAGAVGSIGKNMKMTGDVMQAIDQMTISNATKNIAKGVNYGTLAGGGIKAIKDYYKNLDQLDQIASRE